jgi:hypothetical protein
MRVFLTGLVYFARGSRYTLLSLHAPRERIEVIRIAVAAACTRVNICILRFYVSPSRFVS